MKRKLTLAMMVAALPAAALAQQSQSAPSRSSAYGQQGQAADTNYTDSSMTKRDSSGGAIVQDSTKRDSSGGAAQQDSMKRDTSTGEIAPDSLRDSTSDSTRNQTQSGVIDSAGASTLGPQVTKTKPTQGAAVTSKGDTLKQGGDSTARATVAHPRYDSASTWRDSSGATRDSTRHP
ncbi:MAG TPA: hypothetical protein VFS44_14235 [Gemmatimonadaceae bacterium]|nr:hypothetical protein [Gemmatimonadaceae bacterium]